MRTSTFASTLLTLLSITRAANGYAGALSVELLSPKLQDGDPYEIAREIKGKAESVMRSAGVM